MAGGSKPTPRPRFKLDVDFLGQDTIEQLRDDHGPAGPLLIVAVIAGAKEADLSGVRPPAAQGKLSVRAVALGRKIGADAEVVLAIVRSAVDLGLLECCEGTDLVTGRLVLRSLKRRAWEPFDATAAARKARSRQAEDDDADQK